MYYHLMELVLLWLFLAHDTRDYEFATKFGLNIIPVLEGGDVSKEAFTGDGVHINSGFLNGLGLEEAKNKVIKYLEDNKIGERKINYKLRDWVFSRQKDIGVNQFQWYIVMIVVGFQLMKKIYL